MKQLTRTRWPRRVAFATRFAAAAARASSSRVGVSVSWNAGRKISPRKCGSSGWYSVAQSTIMSNHA